MNSIQHLYSALGEIIYGIASAKSIIPHEEEELLRKIVGSELNKYIRTKEAAVIFNSKKSGVDNIEGVYQKAMNDIQCHGQSLSPVMKALFISIIKKVAAIFPPVIIESQNITDRFVRDINCIN